MRKQEFARLGIVICVVVLLYGILIARLAYWQILKADTLRDLGLTQSTQSIDIPAKRGEILFSDSYPLATNSISYLLFANPKLVESVSLYSDRISSLTSVEPSTLSAQLNKDLFWVRLADNLSAEQKSAIEKLEYKGLGFDMITDRYYPEASMAAHLVGFVGKDDSGMDKGYFGIEGYYNELLKGRHGKRYVVQDALGNPILNDVREEPKIDGRSLVLTIDRTIQFIAEKKLKEGIEKYEAEGGSVIIMEPKTGRILSMASFPQFDPQQYFKFNEYKNPVISSVYEPGSTFKVLVMAAGIDAGVVKPDTKCTDCSGPVTIGEYQIKTWNNKYYTNTTMSEVIQHSDNTGMVFVARKLGLENMLDYFETFGIGDKTGIDLQGEISGTIRDSDSWYPIDLATASFGQGISITPLQLITAVSSLANEGRLMKPFVVDSVISDDGEKIVTEPEEIRRTVKSSTAKVMTAIMVNAVEKGESKWTKLKGYHVAGKTGTAQIPIAGHYDPNQTIASFVGFFPAEDPKISMLVVVDRPKTSIYGSETAAPIFFSIAEDIVNYYKIPPTY